MQPDKRAFVFQYKGNQIPRRLAVNQTINQVIAVAKKLFNCSDEDHYSLFVNEKEVNEELQLCDLNLVDRTILDLVEKLSPNDLLNFWIYHDSKEIEWQGYSSKPIRKALEAFYESQGLTSSIFKSEIDGKELDENIKLGAIPDLDEIFICLVRKAGAIRIEEEKIDTDHKEIEFTFNSLSAENQKENSQGIF